MSLKSDQLEILLSVYKEIKKFHAFEVAFISLMEAAIFVSY